MNRELKISETVSAKACEINSLTGYEFKFTGILAVDLTGSMALYMFTNDAGICIHNELKFGYYVSWKDFNKEQELLQISKENYEEFLDEFLNKFSDCVLSNIHNIK